MLAVVLWGGGALNNLSGILNTDKVYAADFPSSAVTPEGEIRSAPERTAEEIQASKEKADWFVDGLVSAFKKLGNGVLSTVLNVIAGVQGLVVVPVLGVIMRIAGALLNLSVIYTLDSNNLTSVNTAIQTVWKIVRDLFNITFIFVLLYAAIKTILGISGSNTKKIIAQVIVAALLINFSLFITRVCIDVGNLLAANLYNTATADGAKSMGTMILDSTQLSGLWDVSNWKSLSLESPSLFFAINLQIVLLYIAIGTFFYITIMFLTRNILLIFLMALSPIGFMGNVLPKIEEYSKMWRENLFGQISIAPIFLLLFYLISLITGTIKKAILASPNQSWFHDSDQNYLTYFQYLMVILLLIIATKITKKLSGEVGKFIESGVKAALIAGAAVISGGAAIAVGARAGGGILSATKKFVKGTLGDEPGAVGVGARFARSRIMNTFKTGTGGRLDLQKLEKDYKQSKKENEDRVMKKLEAIGPQKAFDEEKRLNDTLSNINQQISKQNPNLITKSTQDGEKVQELEAKIKESDKKIDEAIKEKAAATTIEQKALIDAKIAAATKEKTDAQSGLSGAKFAKLMSEKALTDAQDKVAKSMGTDIKSITDALANTGQKILEGMERKNEYIKDFAGSGMLSTGMARDDREKVVARMRAQQGKYTGDGDLRKQLEKLMKDAKIAPEADKPAEKKTT